jgi:hypothetical protein
LKRFEYARKPDGYWTPSRIRKEAKKYKTRTSFIKGASSAYNAARELEILDKVCVHMITTQKPKGYWTKDRIINEAKKYKTLADFRREGSAAYKAGYRRDMLSTINKLFK